MDAQIYQSVVKIVARSFPCTIMKFSGCPLTLKRQPYRIQPIWDNVLTCKYGRMKKSQIGAQIYSIPLMIVSPRVLQVRLLYRPIDHCDTNMLKTHG